MTSVYVTCPACRGVSHDDDGNSCTSCRRIGRVFAPGAPGYGCSQTLADRDPGEVVTLGNGDRGKILWHMPRKTKKVRPHTTFMGLLGEFTDTESHRPIAYPSCVGVASVEVSKVVVDRDAHDREKSIDYNDPIHRHVAGRLI